MSNEAAGTAQQGNSYLVEVLLDSGVVEHFSCEVDYYPKHARVWDSVIVRLNQAGDEDKRKVWVLAKDVQDAISKAIDLGIFP